MREEVLDSQGILSLRFELLHGELPEHRIATCEGVEDCLAPVAGNGLRRARLPISRLDPPTNRSAVELLEPFSKLLRSAVGQGLTLLSKLLLALHADVVFREAGEKTVTLEVRSVAVMQPAMPAKEPTAGK